MTLRATKKLSATENERRKSARPIAHLDKDYRVYKRLAEVCVKVAN